MGGYNQSVVVSSFVKSGTLLTNKIVNHLTKLQRYNQNRTVLESTNVTYGGINFVSKEHIKIAVNLHDENNSIYKHFLHDVTPEIDLDVPIHYTGHMQPSGIAENPVFNQIEKKIYVYRFGLDVLNSKTKFIENLPWVYDIMKYYEGDHKRFQKLRYASVDKIQDFLTGWLEHVEGYLLNKEHFYGISYEALLNNPEKEIKSLADYLEISISDDAVNEIIDQLFYKELSEKNLQHQYYRHYNKGKKVDEWKSYLSYDYYQEFVNKNKSVLKQLGYSDKTNIPAYASNDFHEVFKRKYDVYSQRRKSLSPIGENKKTSIEDLTHYLHEKKIAVYGYNKHTKRVLDKLDPSTEVVLICDETSDKGDQNPMQLLEQVLHYDYLLVGVSDDAFARKKEEIRTILKEQGSIEVINCSLT